MRLVSKSGFFLIYLLSVVSSCTPEKEDCGCGGSTYRTLDNLPARYTGEGTFVVPDSAAGFLSLSACDVDPAWEVSRDVASWNYTLSGQIKRTCLGPNPELRLPSPGGPIQITSIKKK
ncbi:hypothetical protein ACFQ4C_21340 [Larkinella insperata]|uniref:Uncharacterized protein n=1 Tax=Larkinella insperata TaxID=332158 RepID=A0ABW3Q8K2_9BACT